MTNLKEMVKQVVKQQMREDKEKLVRMCERYMARGMRWTPEEEDNYVERMWAVGVRAFPEYANDEFNFGYLEQMIEDAESDLEETA
jgi:hypothetical protein